MARKTPLLPALALALGLTSPAFATEPTSIERSELVSAGLNAYLDNGAGLYTEFGGEANLGPASLLYFVGLDLDKAVIDAGAGVGINLGKVSPYGRYFYTTTVPGTPLTSQGQGWSTGINFNLSDKLVLFGEYASKNHSEDFDDRLDVEGPNQAAETNSTIRLGARIRTQF